jgi:hypothetical protein
MDVRGTFGMHSAATGGLFASHLARLRYKKPHFSSGARGGEWRWTLTCATPGRRGAPRRTDCRCLGIVPPHCDGASRRRKSLFLARILLRRGRSVGRAGEWADRVAARPPRGARVGNSKTPRRGSTGLVRRARAGEIIVRPPCDRCIHARACAFVPGLPLPVFRKRISCSRPPTLFWPRCNSAREEIEESERFESPSKSPFEGFFPSNQRMSRMMTEPADWHRPMKVCSASESVRPET